MDRMVAAGGVERREGRCEGGGVEGGDGGVERGVEAREGVRVDPTDPIDPIDPTELLSTDPRAFHSHDPSALHSHDPHIQNSHFHDPPDLLLQAAFLESSLYQMGFHQGLLHASNPSGATQSHQSLSEDATTAAKSRASLIGDALGWCEGLQWLAQNESLVLSTQSKSAIMEIRRLAALIPMLNVPFEEGLVDRLRILYRQLNNSRPSEAAVTLDF